MNTAKGWEATTLLDIVETISNTAREIDVGSVLIWNDNRLLVSQINNQDLTESQFTQDSWAEVSRIKEIIEKTNIRIEIT